jgi:hypothetical protein
MMTDEDSIPSDTINAAIKLLRSHGYEVNAPRGITE